MKMEEARNDIKFNFSPNAEHIKQLKNINFTLPCDNLDLRGYLDQI